MLVGFVIAACSVYTPDDGPDTSGSTVGASGAFVNPGGSSASGSSTGGSSSAGGPAPSQSGTSTVVEAGGGELGDGGVGGVTAGGASDGGTTMSGGKGGAPTGAGSGGGSAQGGSGGTAGDGVGGSTVIPPSNTIDDFEDKDISLETRGTGLTGVWYLFNDGTVGKAGPDPLKPVALSDAPTALGGYAMHITATGFTGWGSGLGADFRDGRKAFDASQHTGVRFWARVDSGEVKNTPHRLQIPDATTDAAGMKCNPASNAAKSEQCGNHFGIDETFTTTWKQYVVAFTDLTQAPGWGKTAAKLDKANVFGLQIITKEQLEVDLWIDQIEFY